MTSEAFAWAAKAAALAETATEHDPAIEAYALVSIALSLAAARGEPPEPAGTETRCPLEGVHEHVFRGPHRFREWEPGP